MALTAAEAVVAHACSRCVGRFPACLQSTEIVGRQCPSAVVSTISRAVNEAERLDHRLRLTQYSPSEEIGDGVQDAEVVTVQLANTTLLDVRGRQMGDGDLKKLLNVFGDTRNGLTVDIDVSDNESKASRTCKTPSRAS